MIYNDSPTTNNRLTLASTGYGGQLARRIKAIAAVPSEAPAAVNH